MKAETVQEIQGITSHLAEILVSIEPANPGEWEAMEKMQAAHKQMRSIDTDGLIDRPPRAGLTR